MKIKLLLLGLLAVAGALTSVSTAASTSASVRPVVSIGPATNLSAPKSAVKPFAAPSYCSPCLFYSGDMNTGDPNSTGLFSGNIAGGFDGAVYQDITPDADWLVSAIIVNGQMGNGGVVDPVATPWEIRTGMGPGSGSAGSVYASGTGTASTPVATGRVLSEPEYTVKVTLATPVLLHAGVKYYVDARPQCTNGGDPACPVSFTTEFFQSNVKPAGAPLNHFGPPNVDNDNFFNSVAFAANFIQAWPAAPSGPCFAACEQFSVALQGTPATGTITVTKHLISNSSDPAKFNLRIDGTTYAANVGNGGTTGQVTVLNGNHTVSETAGTNASLGNYVTRIECSDGSAGWGTSLSGVHVNPLQNVTCTITNTRKLFRVG